MSTKENIYTMEKLVLNQISMATISISFRNVYHKVLLLLSKFFFFKFGGVCGWADFELLECFFFKEKHNKIKAYKHSHMHALPAISNKNLIVFFFVAKISKNHSIKWY